MRFGSASLAFLVGLLLVPAASASTITTTVQFTATNFSSVQGTTPPVDPVSGSFTLTFDPSQLALDATTISVNSLNINLGSPIVFSYNPSLAILSIGGSALGSGGFFWATDDFSLAYRLVGGLFEVDAFSYSQLGINDSYSASLNTVPVPAALPLLATALALLTGLGLRRSRLKAT